MRKTIANRILRLLCVAVMVLLSGCGAKKAAEPVKTEQTICTVSFYDGETLLKTRAVPAGSLAGVGPEGIAFWRGEDGVCVDPSVLTVWEDVSFYVWRGPKLREGHVRLMETEGARFFPRRTVSRGEAAEILYTMVEDGDGDLYAVSFPDVSESDRAGEAIRALCAMGVMEGYRDGTFRPEAKVTQGEYVVMLYRLAGMPDIAATGASGGFGEDLEETAAAWGEETGCLPDGPFVPARELTRAAAAVMTSRFRGGQFRPEDIDIACPRAPFADVDPSSRSYYEIIDAAYRNELLSLMDGTAEGIRSGVRLLSGRLCHVNGETHALDRYEPGFVTVDGELYHVSEEGYFLDRMEEGLVELEGHMYCVPEADGPFLTEGEYGYLRFDEKGWYTSGSDIVDEAVEELLKDILADEDLSKRDKLYAGYCAIRDGDFYYRTRNAGWYRGSTLWALPCAEVMYTEKYGICYHWAAAFLYVAQRVGYQAYPVCGGVGTGNQNHAWVVVLDDDGEKYICDVELEWANRRGFYEVEYAPTDMFMQPEAHTQVIYVSPDDGPELYQSFGVSMEESEEHVFHVPEEDHVSPFEPEEL